MADTPWHVAFLGGDVIEYQETAPPPWLAPWAAVQWRMRARAASELTVLPDGCMDIIEGDVVGSLRAPITVTFAAGETASGVRFHPGGLPALLGVPASELVDLRVALAEVLPRRTPLRRVATDADPPDPLGRAAYETADLRSLRRDSGYSERQFRRRVLSATGHAPKRLMRIGRMQRLLLARPSSTWAVAATSHGFFDEAHMVNDVQELAGATPRQLAAKMAVPSNRPPSMVSFNGHHEDRIHHQRRRHRQGAG